MPDRIYRLDVTFPPGSDEPDWEPPNWDSGTPEPWDSPDWEPNTFRWPRVRRFFSRPAANRRAELLRSYGATVTVRTSDPITWGDTQ